MFDPRNSIEATSFRQARNGFVFRAPNPWLFGTADHFLVNEDQKAQILTILTPRRPIALIALSITVIIGWAAAMSLLVWAFGSGQDNPSAIDLLVMTLIIAVPLILAVPAFVLLQQRRLRPVLATAPRTKEHITHREIRRAMMGSMSVRQLLLNGIFAAIGCLSVAMVLAMRNDRHPLFTDAVSVVMFGVMILGGLSAVVYLARALRKARQ